MQTYRGFPVTEQVRLSESPSRKIPGGGTILTVGATVGRHREREGVLGGSVREDERISQKKQKKKRAGVTRRQWGEARGVIKWERRGVGLEHLFPWQPADNPGVGNTC